MHRGRGVKDNDKDPFEGQRRTDTMILGNERRQSVDHRSGLTLFMLLSRSYHHNSHDEK